MHSKLFLFSFFIFSALLAEPAEYKPPEKLRKASSFMYMVDIPKMQKKFSEPLPEWMKKRIEGELTAFKRKFSQEAIDKTHERLTRVVGEKVSTRYRVIQGKVYRKGNDPYGMDRFFRTFPRISEFPGIPDVPDVDFILNHNDATPLASEPHNYWIAEDFKDQAPIMTFARPNDAPYLISIPDRFTLAEWWKLCYIIRKANELYPWEEKTKTAFWRGQSNDFARFGTPPETFEETAKLYSDQPRFRLCTLAAAHPETIDAGFNGAGFCATPHLIELIKPYCRKGVGQADHLTHAYLPVVDGFTSTYPGYVWRLLSNSVAFKQDSPDSQWFYDALKPYVHYVPISYDMNDLLAQIEWAKQHEEECCQISENAQRFVLENLMIEDIYYYFLNILQAYAKCQNYHLADLLGETESDPEWLRIR